MRFIAGSSPDQGSTQLSRKFVRREIVFGGKDLTTGLEAGSKKPELMIAPSRCTRARQRPDPILPSGYKDHERYTRPRPPCWPQAGQEDHHRHIEQLSRCAQKQPKSNRRFRRRERGL